MAIAPSLITNLSLGSIGLITAGGLAYGGYKILKDRPKAISELLSLKKKIALSQNEKEDEDLWKASWNKYVAKYNPQKPAVKPKDLKEVALNPLPEEPIKDVWELGEKLKQKEVPPEFKQKCKKEEVQEVSGTWTKEFNNYLEYCTKNNPSDE